MESTIKVHIENFAKIEKADIKIAPLMFFVGDNNSGKSYLLSLLWGLLTQSHIILEGFDNCKSSSISKCKEWLKLIITNEGIEYEFDQEKIVLFNQIINEIIKINKDKFVSYIFNSDMTIGQLTVDIHLEEKFYFKVAPLKAENTTLEIMKDSKVFSVSKNKEHSVGIFLGNDAEIDVTASYLLKYVLQFFMSFHPFTVYGSGNVVFLPAARTGLLLSRKFITNIAYDKLNPNFYSFLNNMKEDSTEEDSYFTKPFISFLKLINSINSKNMNIKGKKNSSDYQSKLQAMIESEILGGSLEIKESLNNSIVYSPYNSDKEIKIFVTSSVITEVAPLYLIFKYKMKLDYLLIEEPEICLHPKFQWIIARVLIQLSNYGIPVMITTHSDTIIQLVNNMIKLNNNPKRDKLMKEYNYSKKDLVVEPNIEMYQFNCIENTSSVKRLNYDKYGFVVPTFNNSLQRFFEETMALQEDL